MNDMILILNYSDEFAVEAAKRLRGERVFCKIISGTTTAAQVAEIAPRGLVLCGEPKSAENTLLMPHMTMRCMSFSSSLSALPS